VEPRDCPVFSLVSVMIAPGIIPPVASMIAPEIDPVIVCALAVASKATINIRMVEQRRKLSMGIPPSSLR
jgi:hypothetical protein